MSCDLKVGVFGGKSSEKTSITLRYLTNEYNEDMGTTCEDEYSKMIEIDNKAINLVILDNAGQDDFSEMRFSYYNKIQAALLVFDISNRQSVDEIKTIYEDIKDTSDNDVIFAIAANRGYLRNENKKDLIQCDEYKKLEKHFNSKVFETNAKTGQNVSEIFQYITKQYLASIEKEKFPKDKKQKNSRIVLTTNIQSTSSDLLKKRSTSFVPKLMSKKKLVQQDSTDSISSSSSTGSGVFESPIGLEIKTILQSRTKQLYVALEEKKELEKKLIEKEDELQRALQRIKELESELNIVSDDINDDDIIEPQKKKKARNSNLADYSELKHKKGKRRSLNIPKSNDLAQEEQIDGNLRKHNLSDDDQIELKKSKRKSQTKENLTDDASQYKEHKKKKSKKSDSHKKLPMKNESLTLERLKKLANPNTNDLFTKKIRVFNTDEIDQLKKVKELGRGSIEEVIKVTRKQTMAMIVFDNINSEDQMEKLLKQYELLNQLKHPNILRALGCCFGDDSHKPSMLFEYYTSSLRKNVTKLTNEEKVSLIYEVADALKQANFYGIPHLCLNPDNILVGPENHAKVTDFGISSLFNFDSFDSIKEKFGSATIFMAPEQLLCIDKVDELVDVFSFGVISYFVISNGEVPKIDSNDEKGIKIDVSSLPDCFNKYASSLISKCCSQNPEDRLLFADIVYSLEDSLDLIDGVDISLIKSRLQMK